MKVLHLATSLFFLNTYLLPLFPIIKSLHTRKTIIPRPAATISDLRMINTLLKGITGFPVPRLPLFPGSQP